MSEALEQIQAAQPRRFRPYPEYKDSGVEWLGELPAHWEMKRLWHLTPCHRRIMYGIVLPGPDVDDGVPIVKGGDVAASRLKLEYLSKTTREIESRYARSRLRGGDLVYAIRGSIGEVEMVPDELDGANLTQDAARVAYTQTTNGRWLMYALRSKGVFSQLEAGALGATIKGINIRDLKRALVPVPPKREQRAMGSFLDRETATIDELVAGKERLIELLHEKRTALITRAVTRGLDPNVPMKHSGVEWLGEIPVHWDVKRLKFLLAEPLKYGANEAAELDDPDLPRYVRITDIDDSDGLRDDTFKSLPVDVAREYLLREGDLLFARSGATAGKTFLYTRSWGTCAYAGYLIRARLDSTKACPEFVRYFTASSSYWQWLSSTFIQATIQNVSAEKYAGLVMSHPPYPEQRAIVASLGRETARIDALVAKVREAIDRLKEFRTALISAAVTGKIDVREELQ